MNIMNIQATKTTPGVELNPNGTIKIRGRSIHENIIDFFKPVEEWIENYVNDEPAEMTSIEINLEYFNSASAKSLVSIFQKLLEVELKGGKLIVDWYYEDGDDDMQEKGEYFASVLKLPFNFRMIN